jgi:signal transduction histidine kinase
MGAERFSTKTSDIPTTQRVVMRDIQGVWLDRLLIAACEVSPTARLDDALVPLLEAVGEDLPDAALGVCVPTPRGQLVVRRSMREPSADARDPSRLFPEFRFERVVVLACDEGATLHVAADDDTLVDEGGPCELIMARLALVLGSAIRGVRERERARSQTLEVQAQVIQTEKLASLGQIAAGIVHELNNPLTSILAYSDYLRRKSERAGGDPSDLQRLVRISEAAERILRFSRDLTAYARPSAEVPAPVAIHDVIDRALVFCEHVLDQTGVLVERNFGKVRAVRGVAGQLTQVFVNLFTNAAQAMRDGGGCITITTEMTTEDEVSITIIDDGAGIDEGHLPRIFEPFFTTKTDGTGTGLGLSIVRNIVVNHGGRIEADGHKPRGTMFRLELPSAAAPKSEPT